ncbi:response regulator transcription factor [Paucibacter sp. M5-1]|uniref:response regulator transcription factor n=1 Tax=Paucibacter sp. M5-1 TaxID=3015998 RepID=UPI0022B8BA9A|nr:response regulator transcription factor [Paucibacter sp. M5-1]MCZ7881087.1 response regulator transcription factor [Paucibacter sp. M5-1]
MSRVAVIEDSPDLLDDVLFQLRHAGFDAEGAADAAGCRALLASFQPQMLVLDLGLPDEDGLALARWLRASRPQLGIVMLTARTSLRERLAGHEGGADHYLCKPVDAEELLAVLRSLERRLRLSELPAWVLDLHQLELRLPAGPGEPLPLNAVEACILATLARAPLRRASRRELVEALGEDWLLYDERRIETVLSRLRRKIAVATGAEAPLRTLRGFGYAFVEGLRVQ